MRTRRYKIRDAAVLLNGGEVFVAGGAPRAEVYDPATGIFSLVAGTIPARFYSTATLLASGEVLVAGGYGERMQPEAGAWIYQPD
jgi:hypothetical protein